ncbi:butyryl-coa dehydrogenase [Agrilactobacillus composti DSM 18527 = JCM 14202]|uniref:Butyryl-coa dehydrogenase n=1 Tax=Agrilactobacillus composti DSM 18527 = JCM 14202 TaxID=1423734 RepID=X0PTL7_9LACO|nr:acyl-CoA dehydrogenase family protein [Agrilactobacillus composti]KRM32848.1 butyryl-coa dehydrogenase [Agrilactobacillus composti DSM 18527 = JCM 14202]GAF40656.1 butyryl-CoA dehydrogenase [Agrilactobacillus composti DSM 18527 = JCM 14202]
MVTKVKLTPGHKMTEEQFQNYLIQIKELAEGPFDEMQKEVEVTNTFPKEFFQLAIDNDLYRFALPLKYGGFGLSQKQIFQVQEMFSRGPGGMRMHLHHAADLNWRIMDEFGSEDLKKKVLPKVQDKEIYTNFALTEKTGGTGADVHTTAIEDGDYYILNGEKYLISHTDCSDATYVIAVTDPDKEGDDRLSAFWVPVDLPGYEIVPMPHMMGCRGAGHAGLKFTNVKVPKEYLLGKRGDGLHVAISSLSISRAHIADSNLGMAQRMLEMSIARAKDRVTFGKPLVKRQMIQQQIADMGTEIFALRSMLYDLAEQYDKGEDITEKAAMCKLQSINTVRMVSDYTLETFGGIGYFEDNPYGPVERMYRDCRAMWLEEGPRSVQRVTAARHLIQDNGVIK